MRVFKHSSEARKSRKVHFLKKQNSLTYFTWKHEHLLKKSDQKTNGKVPNCKKHAQCQIRDQELPSIKNISTDNLLFAKVGKILNVKKNELLSSKPSFLVNLSKNRRIMYHWHNAKNYYPKRK